MDADTRHQLKQNELAEVLGKLQSVDRTTVMWIVAIVLILALWGGYKAYGWWQQQQQAATWAEFIVASPQARPGQAPPTQTLREFINSDSPELADLARVRLAAALVQEASSGAAGADQKLQEALSAVQTTAADTTAPLAVRGPAYLLMARIYEDQGDWDAARATYETLAQDEFAGSPAHELAKANLSDLDLVSTEFTFAPGMSPDAQAAGETDALGPMPPLDLMPTEQVVTEAAQAEAADTESDSAAPPAAGSDDAPTETTEATDANQP